VSVLPKQAEAHRVDHYKQKQEHGRKKIHSYAACEHAVDDMSQKTSVNLPLN